MNKLILTKISTYSLLVFLLLQGCKKDPVTPAPIVVADQTFTQSFDLMSTAVGQGWIFKNLSDSANLGWSVTHVAPNRNVAGFSSVFDGTNYLEDNYTSNSSPSGLGNISDWAISPKLFFQNGDKISFYAISNGGSDGYPDRLQLRLNVLNTLDSTGVDANSATKSFDVGFYSKPLLDINSLYSTSTTITGFPSIWTKYEVTISGLNQPDSGRFAFRYFLEVNGGSNGDELAIDKVTFTSVNHK